MDSNIIVALIGAAATIIAAVISVALQRQHRSEMKERHAPAEPIHEQPSRKANSAERPKAPVDEHIQDRSGGTSQEEEPVVEEEPLPLEAEKTTNSDAAGKPVPVPCPSCGKSFGVTPKHWFKKLRCRGCQSVFRPNPTTLKGELVRTGMR